MIIRLSLPIINTHSLIYSGLPMEVFLIMINIVLFSSDNVVIENRKEVENNQIYYMLMLHRLVRFDDISNLLNLFCCFLQAHKFNFSTIQDLGLKCSAWEVFGYK